MAGKKEILLVSILLVVAASIFTIYYVPGSKGLRGINTDLPLIIDGEGIPYRSTVFAVDRPSPIPYPDLVGATLYAYFIDGPGGHVEQVTEHIFEQAWLFTEELGAAKFEGRWGYIDRSWDFVIAPQFAWAEPFAEGLAAVKYGGRYGYIDRDGSFVLEPAYLNARFFGQGLAPVQTEQGWIYIDRSGNTVIPGPFERAESFSATVELATVMTGGQWGFIDLEGKMVIQPQYDDVWSFTGYGDTASAWVKSGEQWIRIKSPLD